MELIQFGDILDVERERGSLKRDGGYPQVQSAQICDLAWLAQSMLTAVG